MQKLIQDVSLGENLQQIRKSCNLSQYDVVRELQLRGRDMSRANYAHIEQGIRNIFVSDLVLLQDIFGVPYEEFFKGLASS